MTFENNLFCGLKTSFSDFYFPGNRTVLPKTSSWFSSEIAAVIKKEKVICSKKKKRIIYQWIHIFYTS